MLFNSHLFILGFLPAVLCGVALLHRFGSPVRCAWLLLVSLTFYGWSQPRFLLVLAASILVNFIGARIIAGTPEPRRRRWIAGLFIGLDLAALGAFKYSGLMADTLSQLFGGRWPALDLALPLGISFYTFTQIAFLADTCAGRASEPSLLRYGLFVTYFPHLIAGPILHHGEMMPQFASPAGLRVTSANLAVGATLFIIGLFKKVAIADSLSPFVHAVFDTPGTHTLVDSWIGALGYTAQIYFDFSGYCDMAVGLSKMLGVLLPVNFDSPYKAVDIIDFWRRWHITLSRFLRDYLYIPLGGNRKGDGRQQFNLMATMLLGGLWHGAGWTFVLWGGLHGVYLVVNHAWVRLRDRAGWMPGKTWVALLPSRVLTLLAVIAAWVLFRAASLPVAVDIWRGLCGVNGVILPYNLAGVLAPVAALLRPFSASFGVVPHLDTAVAPTLLIVGAFAVAFLLPNSQTLTRRFAPALLPRGGPVDPPSPLAWSPTLGWGLAIAGIGAVAGSLLFRETEFLYFRF